MHRADRTGRSSSGISEESEVSVPRPDDGSDVVDESIEDLGFARSTNLGDRASCMRFRWGESTPEDY